MAPFVEEGNPLVEEEDCIVVELVPVSESLTDLRLEEVTSTIAPTPRSFGEKDAGICKPPVTRFHLILMEEHISPPSIDICHELLFDPKVKMRMQHFQIHSPKSIKSSEEYWRALQCELDMISDPKLCSVHPATLLPHLLEEIKSMLLYLYPDSKMINEQLFSDMDIPFVVQQLQLGNMCSSELAALFGAILKANCAPKRDGMIDHMILLGSEGNWIGMFKLCLELMEYMKLVRFHPRRRTLIANLVHRERQHFKSLFESGRLPLKSTISWLQSGAINNCPEMDIPVNAFASLCVGGTPIPETFVLDHMRLQSLRDELQDLFIISSALLVFRQWCQRPVSGLLLNDMKRRLHRSLGCHTTKVSDLALQVHLVASRARGSGICGAERDLLQRSVDTILHPNNPAYLILKRKVTEILKMFLLGRTIHNEMFTKCGLDMIQVELEDVFKRAKFLWSVNYKTHCELYKQLSTGQLSRMAG